MEIITHQAAKPLGAYPHAKKVGDFLYLSGIGPRKANSDEIPGLKLDKHGNYLAFDFEAQCQSVFDNVKTVLEESGAQLENLIDITVFLTDMKRDFHIYNKLYTDFFGAIRPCRTTVEVSSLPSAICIELKCIAYLKPNTI
ncbi:MAG: RidA family protein [Chitinophagales bacterium]|jgi:2-aminomuconate deaminase|nr:RidA family protein [Chitinophagales bacterium]